MFRGTLDNYNECLTSPLKGERPAYEELFNLKEDPRETANIASDATYSNVLNNMRQRLQQHLQEAKGDDSPPLTIPFQS